MRFKFKLSHGATLPESNNPTDTGYDLKAKGYSKDGVDIWFDEMDLDVEKYIYLWPGERMLIKTGVQVKLPEKEDYEAFIIFWDAGVRPRSGLALKHGITVLNSPGTIDNEYTGDIGVILMNTGKEKFLIRDNDRIAQLVLDERVKPKTGLFEIVDSFEETARGDKGFGSSGVE